MTVTLVPPATTGTWPVHPAADLFPLLAETELRELCDDIKANGLLEPVWLCDHPQFAAAA